MAKKARPGRIQTVSSEDALAFIRRMQRAFPKTPRSRKEKERLHKYLAKFSDDELKAVGSRVLSDVMLRPAKTISPGDYPLQPPARPAIVARTRSKNRA
jgi:hypothetical protein